MSAATNPVAYHVADILCCAEEDVLVVGDPGVGGVVVVAEEKILTSRVEAAEWYVSNCRTAFKRELHITTLDKYMAACSAARLGGYKATLAFLHTWD